jgi:hypothetical protein
VRQAHRITANFSNLPAFTLERLVRTAHPTICARELKACKQKFISTSFGQRYLPGDAMSDHAAHA